MLISKFDLYKDEWLDLVFTNRNQAYGAYELRQHNSRNTVKALVAMMGSILVVAFVFGVILKPAIHQPEVVKMTVVPLINVVKPPPVQPDKPAQPHTVKPPAAPAASAPTIRFVTPVVAPDPAAVDPPKATDLANTNIGPADLKGTPGATPAVDQPEPPGGGGGGGDDIHQAGIGLEREPMPKGGFEAFGKFLQKHLHYPGEASDNHIQGKVYLSFIVEKDGSLSNITIIRGPGFGTNEEAERVLKLAPSWNPGIQNNQPVRVQYTIPINFQMTDEDN